MQLRVAGLAVFCGLAVTCFAQAAPAVKAENSYVNSQIIFKHWDGDTRSGIPRPQSPKAYARGLFCYVADPAPGSGEERCNANAQSAKMRPPLLTPELKWGLENVDVPAFTIRIVRLVTASTEAK
jgi:hypothetical protein